MKTAFRLLAPLAALAAALLFAPAAGAAPASTKLSLSGPAKAPGGVATLTARLTAGGSPVAGKAIELYGGQATPLAAGSTDASGKIAFEVTVTASTQFQASYTPAAPDAASLAPAKSRTLTVSPVTGTRLSVRTFLHARHRAVGVPRVPIRVKGTLAPYAATVTVDVFQGTKRIKHASVAVAQAGAAGRFSFSFKPRARGVYRIRASDASGSATKRVLVVLPHAGSGSRGTAVRALQSRLRKLGYLTPVNGRFDVSTGRAVLAMRKVVGYARSTNASSAVFKRLARGGGGYRLRHPTAGKHVEFDWSRQVLVLARGAKPVKILHASSGKPSTPTVFGKFRFYRKSPGFNSHGMYYSNYFVGGYAIHGYESVPNYAASHGCIRIPIPSARAVYRWVKLGDPIYVYR